MLTLHTIVHAKSMCPTVTILILVISCGYQTGGKPLLVLLEVLEFVGPDAALEADLVLIGEKLGGGAFTFSEGRKYGSSCTGMEADTAGMESLGMMSCCTGLEAGYLGFRCSFILWRADPS